MLGTLLDRPIVCNSFQHKYPVLVEMCNQELDSVKVLFDEQMARIKTPSGPVINKNMPLVAGMLRWSEELYDRIQITVGRLQSLKNSL